MKKTLSMLLALLTVGSLLVSCSGNDTPTQGANDNSNDVSAQSNEVEETTAEPTNAEKLSAYVASLPDEDYDGYEFIIMTREEAASPYWFTRDVYSEGEDGEPINDAVYARNRALEEKYNIKVKDYQAGGGPSTQARTNINSGEDSFAFLTDGLGSLAQLATSGLAIDYKSLDGIKLENSWWDQRMNTEMTISDKLYFVTGDISIMDNEGTWHMLFNKDIHTDYSLDDYYEMRDNGTWTLDVLSRDAIKVCEDLNGDGVMKPEDDRMGFATEDFNTWALWAGAGLVTTTKDDRDLPVFSMYSEKAATVVDKVLELQTNKQVAFDHNIALDNAYTTGNVMFQLVGMRVLPVYRDSEINFGILPIPKYDESQDRYYSVGSHANLTAYLMPMTTSDVERSATLIEAMAGISAYTLTPAYYDISLHGKYIRDDESSESLTIILENRSYDVGIIFSFGSPLGVFTQMFSSNTRDFASRCAKIETSMQASIDKFIETIGE